VWASQPQVMNMVMISAADAAGMPVSLDLKAAESRTAHTQSRQAPALVGLAILQLPQTLSLSAAQCRHPALKAAPSPPVDCRSMGSLDLLAGIQHGSHLHLLLLPL
jgi:hypothetical protein